MMNLAKLYEQQEQDIKTFENTRDQVWREMKERHNNIIAAHGSRENLPIDSRKLIEIEEQAFQKQWSMEGGVKFKALKAQHAKQFKEITQKPKPNMDIKKKVENAVNAQKKQAEKKVQSQKSDIKKLVTERDKKKAQMVTAQKSIVKKQEELKKDRKRGR